MQLLRPLALVLVTAALLASAASADPKPGRVTQTAVAGVRLGLTAEQYGSVLRERPFSTRYADGTTRLAFPKAELNVFLGSSGKGVRITTAASEYTLRRGVGPCGLFTALARSLHPVPYALHGAFGASALVYRSGHLWFTLADPRHVGSVTLAAGRPELQALIADAQCGVGDEEGE